MAKYLKKSKMRTLKRVLVMTAIIVVVLGLIAAIAVSLHPELLPAGGESNPPRQTQSMQESTGTDVTVGTEPEQTGLTALEYPLILEGGNLRIDSLFQYDGLNPDCGSETGRDVASIMLTNTSAMYLEEAKITLTLTDGTAVNFMVTDLPAGKTVTAFDTANTAVESDALCAVVSCEAGWGGEIEPIPEGIDLTVDGVTVTVTNHTGRDIPTLVVYCRCPMGEEFFGGITYQYTLNDLSANESATVEAWDCLLGMAEVVRIAAN